MAEITPAILPKTYAELEEKLDIVAGHVPFVQIDICVIAFACNLLIKDFIKGPKCITNRTTSANTRN